MNQDLVVTLDLQGFSQLEHADIAARVGKLCPELTIVEADQRHLREIDRTQLQTYCVIISAACASISASVLVSNKIESITKAPLQQAAPPPTYELTIVEIEKRCGIELAPETKVQIVSCASQGQQDGTVVVTADGMRYEIKVSRGAKTHLRGRPMPKQSRKL